MDTDISAASGGINVSVIICTYNRAAVLKDAIESVTGNGLPPDCELIVVDNGSTDDTPSVLEECRSGAGVRFVTEQTRGLSHARNRGVSEAKGDIVIFLDDDARASVGWIEAFRAALKDDPKAAACGGRIRAEFAGEKPWWIFGESLRLYGEYNLGETPIECSWVPGGNSAWRKSVLDELGGFDVRFGRSGSDTLEGGEESQLIYGALAKGCHLVYSPSAVMDHIVPKERMAFSYLVRRWFGQGMTDCRYRAIREEWSAGDRMAHVLMLAVMPPMRIVFGLLSFCVLRLKSGLRQLLWSVRELGMIREACSCGRPISDDGERRG